MNRNIFNYTLSFLLMALFAFSACEQPKADAADQATEVGPATTGKIVFVRQDTVINQYTALQEKQTSLEEKYRVLDEEQQNRVGAFQRQVESFQRRANSGQMAPKQAQNEQSTLALREQQLMEDANRLQQELQYEQLELMTTFQKNVQDVLDEIQAVNNYDYILNYGSGTGVLMTNDAFDITADVVEKLNKLSMDSATEEDATEEEEEASEEG